MTLQLALRTFVALCWSGELLLKWFHPNDALEASLNTVSWVVVLYIWGFWKIQHDIITATIRKHG